MKKLLDVVTLLGLSLLVATTVAVAPAAVRDVFAATTNCTAASATPDAAGSPTSGATVVAVQTAAPEPAQSGDIPDSQAFVAYLSTAGGYSIQMPEGWARTDNGPNVDFSDKTHEFSVEIDCAASAPTVGSVTTNEVPLLSRTIEAFSLVDVKAVSLPAGPAILLRYQANSKPDDVTGKQHRLDVARYEIFKNGRTAVITLAVPAGADNVDVAKQITESFRWTA